MCDAARPAQDSAENAAPPAGLEWLIEKPDWMPQFVWEYVRDLSVRMLQNAVEIIDYIEAFGGCESRDRLVLVLVGLAMTCGVSVWLLCRYGLPVGRLPRRAANRLVGEDAARIHRTLWTLIFYCVGASFLYNVAGYYGYVSFIHEDMGDIMTVAAFGLISVQQILWWSREKRR